MGESFLISLHTFAEPYNLFLWVLGTVLGILVGAMPGISGSMLVALSLPFTFYMEGDSAMVLLISMFVGSVSGGLLTAILLRIPGDPSAVMTTFDGYPMAARGEATRALAYAIFASFFGGLLSWLVLIALTRPLSRIAVIFGPFEYFALVAMALVLIVSVSESSLAKGLFSGFLGILLSLPGIDPSTGLPRLTFGFAQLEAGFGILPVFIGVFAINQILADLGDGDQEAAAVSTRVRLALIRWRDMAGQWGNLIRSSLIGTGIGILPGVGATIASIVSYTAAKNFSRRPEAFGTGIPDGIIAAEAADNGSVCGSLVPLIALGIPGSVTGAILIGALILHGLQPGPLLFVNNPDVVYSIYITAFAANALMFALLVIFGGQFCRIALVPKSILNPIIIVSCVVGAFAASSRMFDVWTMLGLGVLGFWMERNRVPLGPFVIGFVLAPMAEQYLRSALMISGGSLLPFVTRPFSAVFILCAAASLALSLLRRRRPPGRRRVLKP